MIQIKMLSNLLPIEDEMGRRNISILQLSCGNKFIITKSANPEWMVKELKKSNHKYLDKGLYETNLFYPLIAHAYKNNLHIVKVEVLFTSTDGYKVLKFELNQLEMHFGKPDCLNLNNIPYIPKTVLAAKGSNWLTQNQALNFRKLLTKYDY
jgi:hypothetical protein